MVLASVAVVVTGEVLAVVVFVLVFRVLVKISHCFAAGVFDMFKAALFAQILWHIHGFFCQVCVRLCGTLRLRRHLGRGQANPPIMES